MLHITLQWLLLTARRSQVYRVVHKSTGKVVTLRSHVETYANEETGTHSLVGLLQDITEICRMQQQEADQKAAHTALTNMLAAVRHLLLATLTYCRYYCYDCCCYCCLLLVL
jgi:hypothetical protein